jgi:uncharacterized protein with von Willebrand factor type A (vWA) domain
VADAATPQRRPAFGVETIHLDLPRLAAAFGQRLRAVGVPVTPERAADFARAISLVRPVSRRRLYWTARSMFVADESHAAAFDDVFRSIFGGATRTDRSLPTDAEAVPAPADDRPTTDERGSSHVRARERPVTPVVSAQPRSTDLEDRAGVQVPRAIASAEERLAGKRFDALDADELAQVYRLMSRLQLATPVRRARRFEHAQHGRRVDLRRTLRASLRTGGDAIRLARRRRRVVRRRLVVLCDISGSMEPYARAYLQFLACAAGSGPRAEAFAFATRLTRLTRALSSRQPESAIQRAAAAAPDWSSGTRIGDALKEFNDRHGRRGMARGAVVVVLSDGWERGDPELVGREMERLARLAHRIVWVNPRVSASDFSLEAAGMVAALQHCDALVSGHSLGALGEVVEAIAAPARGRGARRAASLRADRARGDERHEERWASATPVAGSSVAMPSGYGPSRGKTTPGWSDDGG